MTPHTIMATISGAISSLSRKIDAGEQELRAAARHVTHGIAKKGGA